MSAANRVAIGLVSLFGLTLVAILFLYAVNPWVEQREIPVIGSRAYDAIGFGFTGAFGAFSIIRLNQRRAWAWWVAFVVSVTSLGLGILLFLSAIYPGDDFARSEAGFGLGISLILMIPGGVSSILLGLPSLRREFLPSKGQPSR